MYRKQISQKASPSIRAKPINKEISPSPSYGSLSSVVQRVQQDPNSVSEDERQQLESAIGSSSTREVLAGKQTPWTPQFQGISTQLLGNSRQVGAPIQAKGKDDVDVEDYSEWKQEIEIWIDTRYPLLSQIDRDQLKALMLEEVIKYAATHPDHQKDKDVATTGLNLAPHAYGNLVGEAQSHEPESQSDQKEEKSTQTSQIQTVSFRGNRLIIGSLHEPEPQSDQKEEKNTQTSFIKSIFNITKNLIEPLEDIKKMLMVEIKKEQEQSNSMFDHKNKLKLLQILTQNRNRLKTFAQNISEIYEPIKTKQSREEQQAYMVWIKEVEKEILDLSNIIVKEKENDLKRQYLTPKDSLYPYAKRLNDDYRKFESQLLRYKGLSISHKFSSPYYIPPEELKNYKIAPLPGQHGSVGYAETKSFVDTTKATMQERTFTGVERNDVYIYVMSPDGDVYVADQGAMEWRQGVSFHHSSFLRGKRVAAAGEVKFVQGKLIEITDQSGHYHPELVYTYQAVQQFQKWGISLQDVTVKLYFEPEKTWLVLNAQAFSNYCKANNVGNSGNLGNKEQLYDLIKRGKIKNTSLANKHGNTMEQKADYKN